MNECTKPLLWDANYDCENNDSTKARELRTNLGASFYGILSLLPCAFFRKKLHIHGIGQDEGVARRGTWVFVIPPSVSLFYEINLWQV